MWIIIKNGQDKTRSEGRRIRRQIIECVLLAYIPINRLPFSFTRAQRTLHLVNKYLTFSRSPFVIAFVCVPGLCEELSNKRHQLLLRPSDEPIEPKLKKINKNLRYTHTHTPSPNDAQARVA